MASTSSSTTRPAAPLSDMPNSSPDGTYLLDQISGQTILIIGVAVLKEAALWVVFLIVGRRILSRPLTALIRAIDATTPENPAPIALDVGRTGDRRHRTDRHPRIRSTA